MSFVSIKSVYKSYDRRPILERVSLDVEEGTFVSIVGASGCGKSTFLRILLAQEQPDRGEISVDGEPPAREPGPDRGVVFQRYSVFPHLTVRGNLIVAEELVQSRFLGRTFGKARKKIKQSADAVLERIGLSHVADAYPAALSGGMRQRLAIGQSLMRRPKILLLDEPFGALDPGTREQMHVFLSDLRREEPMTVFMVTHDIGEGFKLGDRLLVFDKVRHDPQLPETYGATITYDLDTRQHDTPPQLENARNVF
jgi:NitT/TauT family transport system ATP-binding protein